MARAPSAARPEAAAPPWPAAAPGQRHGFTLLELVIAMAVVVVLAAAATPSLGAYLARHRLLSAAHQLGADLDAGRHEAVRHGRPVHVVARAGTPWCYALAWRPSADCRATPDQDSGLLKAVHGDDLPGLQLDSATAMRFEPRATNGTVVPGLLQLRNKRGEAVQVRLSPLGRSSLCSAGTPIPGLSACDLTPPN